MLTPTAGATRWTRAEPGSGRHWQRPAGHDKAGVTLGTVTEPETQPVLLRISAGIGWPDNDVETATLERLASTGMPAAAFIWPRRHARRPADQPHDRSPACPC